MSITVFDHDFPDRIDLAGRLMVVRLQDGTVQYFGWRPGMFRLVELSKGALVRDSVR